MGGSGIRGRKGGLALLVAGSCMAGTAGAAMPGLYFAGFYMDSMLMYSTADVREADLEQSRVDIWNEYGFDVLDLQEPDFDRTDIGYGLSLGYQFTQYFAGELSYVQMGDVSYQAIGAVADESGQYLSRTSLKTRARGLGLSGIVIWPLGDRWSLDARGGMLFGKSKLKYLIELQAGGYDVSSVKGDSTAIMLGAGLNWSMSPGTAIRAGYSRLEDALYNDVAISAWTLSLKYAW